MRTTKIQNIARIVLGTFLTFAGVSHLTFNRTEFLAQVPKWLPINPDLTVVLSGIVEISLGLALIFAVKYKKWVGITAAIFFILIFPGNVSQYVNKVNAFGLNTDNARLIRLFFQPILILWALWSTNALKNKNQ
ncbi:DoxX family membrane protein [Mucilaginibacter achroorhodeus]|uniref:DoxX family membrane protein n=1 Tax=Mucilaginibacter achroorhodeus TaxID=2599294 RepID=A0A563U9T6_9SPHI|nr:MULTISPECIES: DoxX family membrane protein [Mucilaginibacter]QXV66743.1 DoxX family membrane protein [Mucilaginibacter sp. 21P]TWR28151.1 DoxX family membrane protein [Mucilaginibacter achroorhodeus]